MTSKHAAEMIAKFSSIPARTYPYLVRFSVENKPTWDNASVRTVEIVLSNRIEPDSAQLTLKCVNVVEIVVHSLNGTGGCVVIVNDITDRGLEGIRYQISDVENEFFSLQCKDFQFEILE